MRVAVFGAGAVGCYYGGMLARAGHDVTFIGRAAHVEAINANGLLLDTQSFREFVPAKAAVDAAGIAEPDLVLVCVKSSDTEAAGRALKARLSPRTVLLSLQNGVDNAERLGATLGGHAVIPAIVYVGTEMAGPGHVKHHGGGELVIGASASSEATARTLSGAGIPTSIADDIAQALWIKLMINCAYNALSAVGDIAYRPMLEMAGTKEVMTEVLRECMAVAAACGVSIPQDVVASTLALAESMPDQKSSTAQDFRHGRPSEIDFLNGYVVRKGRETGIATPTNQALQVVVKLAEKGRHRPRG
jgi:2-dehydropantoate 2-reductase